MRTDEEYREIQREQKSGSTSIGGYISVDRKKFLRDNWKDIREITMTDGRTEAFRESKRIQEEANLTVTHTITLPREFYVSFNTKGQPQIATIEPPVSQDLYRRVRIID